MRNVKSKPRKKRFLRFRKGEYYQYSRCGCIIKVLVLGRETITFDLIQEAPQCKILWTTDIMKKVTYNKRQMENFLRDGSLVILPKLKRILIMEKDEK